MASHRRWRMFEDIGDLDAVTRRVTEAQRIVKQVAAEVGPPPLVRVRARGQAPDTEHKVLTYNLCFGCLIASSRDRTAMRHDLGRQCLKWKNNARAPVCADNMGKSIAEYASASGGYDLMAFQENVPGKGANGLLGAAFSNLHLKEKIVGGKTLAETHDIILERSMGVMSFGVVSMYNRAKYGKPDMIVSAPGPARPHFLILVFDSQELIFINLHNGQPSHNRTRWSKFPELIDDALQMSHPNMERRKTYRVILAGDFNDAKNELIRDGIQFPWLEKPLRLASPLAKSCCTSRLGLDPRSPGDYILDSASTAVNAVPALYNNRLPQSDHRPVEAILRRSGARQRMQTRRVPRQGMKKWRDRQATRTTKLVAFEPEVMEAQSPQPPPMQSTTLSRREQQEARTLLPLETIGARVRLVQRETRLQPSTTETQTTTSTTTTASPRTALSKLPLEAPKSISRA